MSGIYKKDTFCEVLQRNAFQVTLFRKESTFVSNIACGTASDQLMLNSSELFLDIYNFDSRVDTQRHFLTPNSKKVSICFQQSNVGKSWFSSMIIGALVELFHPKVFCHITCRGFCKVPLLNKNKLILDFH